MTVRARRLGTAAVAGLAGVAFMVGGQDVYTAFVTPPSKSKARDTIKKPIDRSRHLPG
jgi:hypothetical protein